MSASHCTAFLGHQRVAAGSYADVAKNLKSLDLSTGSLLVFDDASGVQVDYPWPAGYAPQQPAATVTEAEVPASPTVGRPKLGVVAREITLLPRHWDWLAAQPGGASVALRKLVEEARKVSSGDDRRRAAQEATFRFMQAMAGDAPGFEDAARALFAGDVARFEEQVARWADDVRDHATWLATDAFGS